MAEARKNVRSALADFLGRCFGQLSVGEILFGLSLAHIGSANHPSKPCPAPRRLRRIWGMDSSWELARRNHYPSLHRQNPNAGLLAFESIFSRQVALEIFFDVGSPNSPSEIAPKARAIDCAADFSSPRCAVSSDSRLHFVLPFHPLVPFGYPQADQKNEEPTQRRGALKTPSPRQSAVQNAIAETNLRSRLQRVEKLIPT